MKYILSTVLIGLLILTAIWLLGGSAGVPYEDFTAIWVDCGLPPIPASPVRYESIEDSGWQDITQLFCLELPDTFDISHYAEENNFTRIDSVESDGRHSVYNYENLFPGVDSLPEGMNRIPLKETLYWYQGNVGRNGGFDAIFAVEQRTLWFCVRFD